VKNGMQEQFLFLLKLKRFHMSHEKNQGLIETLNNCATECSHCAMSCLEEKDVKMLTACIKLNIDCAEVCRMTASLLSRGSEHGIHLLAECAEICNACGTECKEHSHMEHCRKCAEVCFNCAEECTSLSTSIL
jgi:hypothetical protein